MDERPLLMIITSTKIDYGAHLYYQGFCDNYIYCVLRARSFSEKIETSSQLHAFAAEEGKGK